MYRKTTKPTGRTDNGIEEQEECQVGGPAAGSRKAKGKAKGKRQNQNAGWLFACRSGRAGVWFFLCLLPAASYFLWEAM